MKADARTARLGPSLNRRFNSTLGLGFRFLSGVDPGFGAMVFNYSSISRLSEADFEVGASLRRA